MSDIRLTEERLRSYLDTNQFKRESLCIALLHFLGSYTQVKSRRPKGGPDGRRDLEAIFDGQYTVWGGVGFRNGGGNDSAARKEAQNKYRSDLNSALEEKADLTHFVFFTNVDLTPDQITELKQFAEEKGIIHTEVFDLNRLRVVLDSPEGMIARLQYLDIEMSKTDQLGLINKFGDELQTAFTTRIDRVDETLSRLESFLDFQKPLVQRSMFCELEHAVCATDIENEAIYIEIGGMSPGITGGWEKHLIISDGTTPASNNRFDSIFFHWSDNKRNGKEIIGKRLSLHSENVFGYFESSLTSVGGFGVITIAKIIFTEVRVFATPRISRKIQRFRITGNNYDIVNLETTETGREKALALPDELIFPEGFAYPHKALELREVVPLTQRDYFESPPQKSDCKFTNNERSATAN